MVKDLKIGGGGWNLVENLIKDGGVVVVVDG
jgi:hypothetical protein